MSKKYKKDTLACYKTCCHYCVHRRKSKRKEVKGIPQNMYECNLENHFVCEVEKRGSDACVEAECAVCDNFKRKKIVKRPSQLPKKAVGLEIARDILLIVGIDIPATVLRALRREEVERAVNWASRLHLNASDNPEVKVPKKPKWLDDYEEMFDKDSHGLPFEGKDEQDA